MSESIQIVKEFYEALRAGDVNRALAVLSPDLEWTEAEGFPYYSGGMVRKRLWKNCWLRWLEIGVPSL